MATTTGMSLVAYGASDDESDSSDEDHGLTATKEKETELKEKDTGCDLIRSGSTTSTFCQINDEEYESVGSTRESLGHQQKDSVSSTGHINFSTLKGLPHPLRQEDVILTEGHLEEEVKAKEFEIASAPKPPQKKEKRPVKITIPSLKQVQDGESSKKPLSSSTSMKKTGLFSLLPAPINSVKKEVNRPLIPHNLRKTSVKTSKPMNSQTEFTEEKVDSSDSSLKHLSEFNDVTGSDTEGEGAENGRSVNFFSLDPSSSLSESKMKDEQLPLVNKGFQHTMSYSNIETEENRDTAHPVMNTSSINIEDTGIERAQVSSLDLEPGAVNDAPLMFETKYHFSSSSCSFLSPVGPSGPVPPHQHMSYSLPINSMYNMANLQDAYPVDDGTKDNPMCNDDLNHLLEDKEFIRFQGKRKHAMEINFMDAKVDDFVDPSEVSKHLTEETEYVSHKKRDDLPTSQQKRKKQITYLAHQAKERELELKNTWAQNKMTKKQTQSKYGF